MPRARSCLRTFPTNATNGPHSRPSHRSMRTRSADARYGLSPDVEMATRRGSRLTIAGAMKRHWAGRSTTLIRMPAASADQLAPEVGLRVRAVGELEVDLLTV